MENADPITKKQGTVQFADEVPSAFSNTAPEMGRRSSSRKMSIAGDRKMSTTDSFKLSSAEGKNPSSAEARRTSISSQGRRKISVSSRGNTPLYGSRPSSRAESPDHAKGQSIKKMFLNEVEKSRHRKMSRVHPSQPRSVILKHIERGETEHTELDLALSSKNRGNKTDNDSLKGSLEGMEDESNGKDIEVPVSYIDPRTIRWVNRRRLNAVQHTNNRISAQRLRQLREIYNGFEMDPDGTLHLDKFKHAADYVDSKNTIPNHGPLIPSNVGDLASVFRAYDTDHSGSIDFHEFVAGMTSDTSDQQLLNKHQVFFEVATKHRRQNIVDKLSNDSVPDSTRYRNFHKLFQVKFFRTDHVENIFDDGHAFSTKSKTTNKQKDIRNKEVIRSREASLALKAEKTYLQKNSKNYYIPNLSDSLSTSDRGLERPSSSLFEHSVDETISFHEQKRVNKKLSQFSIHGNTFVPKQFDASVKADMALKLRAKNEAGNLLRHRHSVILPPL